MKAFFAQNPSWNVCPPKMGSNHKIDHAQKNPFKSAWQNDKIFYRFEVKFVEEGVAMTISLIIIVCCLPYILTIIVYCYQISLTMIVYWFIRYIFDNNCVLFYHMYLTIIVYCFTRYIVLWLCIVLPDISDYNCVFFTRYLWLFKYILSDIFAYDCVLSYQI